MLQTWDEQRDGWGSSHCLLSSLSCHLHKAWSENNGRAWDTWLTNVAKEPSMTPRPLPPGAQSVLLVESWRCPFLPDFAKSVVHIEICYTINGSNSDQLLVGYGDRGSSEKYKSRSRFSCWDYWVRREFLRPAASSVRYVTYRIDALAIIQSYWLHALLRCCRILVLFKWYQQSIALWW